MNTDMQDARSIQASELRLSVHDSIHHVDSDHWQSFADSASLFLRYDYLVALEDTMGDSMQFRYVLYYCPDHQLVGLAYFQVVWFEDNDSEYQDAVEGIGPGIGKSIIKEKKVRTLVNGNVFHCGEHGFHFNEHVLFADRLLAIDYTFQRLKGDEGVKPKVSAFLIKDIWPEHDEPLQALLGRSFHPLSIDVNMVSVIPDQWNDMNDYEASLNKKARTRLRSITKRSALLKGMALQAEGIREYLPEMKLLFQQVLDRSPFIYGRLNMEVFPIWKEVFADAMLFNAYFLDNELVGFATAFHHGSVLDAHYVGFDYDLNREHLIYQRILLDLVTEAISKDCNKVIFGRTAEQAKSNFGAFPVHMGLMIKHRNSVANKLIGPLISSVKPTEFEMRHPFK